MQLLKEMMERGLTVKVKSEFKNKRGDVFPVGATVACEFKDTHLRVSIGENAVNMPYRYAAKHLTGFKPEPSMRALEKMVNDSIVPTPLGNRVEPDGYGPYGDPSWLIIMGII